MLEIFHIYLLLAWLLQILWASAIYIIYRSFITLLLRSWCIVRSSKLLLSSIKPYDVDEQYRILPSSLSIRILLCIHRIYLLATGEQYSSRMTTPKRYLRYRMLMDKALAHILTIHDHTGANYTPNKPTKYYLKDSQSVVYYLIVGLRHSGAIIHQ